MMVGGEESRRLLEGSIGDLRSAIGQAHEEATHQILGRIVAQMGRYVSLLDERSALIARLQGLALTDELTDLANRRAWEESLERELGRSRRYGQPLCVAMLDLDDFKLYNDRNGHQSGDRLLHEVAQTWRAQLRTTDVLARYGGDEFSLLLPTWRIEIAEGVLGRIRAVTPREQTCSAGLAAFNGAETGEELVSRADAALYEAKARGRDRTMLARADRVPPGDEHGAQVEGS